MGEMAPEIHSSRRRTVASRKPPPAPNTPTTRSSGMARSGVAKSPLSTSTAHNQLATNRKT